MNRVCPDRIHINPLNPFNTKPLQDTSSRFHPKREIWKSCTCRQCHHVASWELSQPSLCPWKWEKWYKFCAQTKKEVQNKEMPLQNGSGWLGPKTTNVWVWGCLLAHCKSAWVCDVYALFYLGLPSASYNFDMNMLYAEDSDATGISSRDIAVWMLPVWIR